MVFVVPLVGTGVYQNGQFAVVQLIKGNKTAHQSRVICACCVKLPHVYRVGTDGSTPRISNDYSASCNVISELLGNFLAEQKTLLRFFLISSIEVGVEIVATYLWGHSVIVVRLSS